MGPKTINDRQYRGIASIHLWLVFKPWRRDRSSTHACQIEVPMGRRTFFHTRPPLFDMHFCSIFVNVYTSWFKIYVIAILSYKYKMIIIEKNVSYKSVFYIFVYIELSKMVSNFYFFLQYFRGNQ